MAQVLIRNLEDDVLEALRARAERNGRALQQELRDILSAAARPTREERVELAAQVRPTGGSRGLASPPEIIGPPVSEAVSEDRR